MRLLAIVFLVMGSLGLTACNTIKGAGQDIQKAGSSIEKAAERSQ